MVAVAVALVRGFSAVGEPWPACCPSRPPAGHDLDVKSSVHPKYTTTSRVGNWAEYDRALVRRGDVTLWLTPDAIATWAAAGVGRRSGQLQYSDLAIETALTLSLIFHVPLRQTEGVLTSIFGILGVDLTAPDHTTLSRRGQHLALALRRARPGALSNQLPPPQGAVGTVKLTSPGHTRAGESEIRLPSPRSTR